ncbi:hypothetical protein [Salimicrobium album]|uniref:Transposase n=1 Tax=Salimicrobium album TaxID=50717 RepID=A0A1H3DAF5_9BACI|nr:hypothetical protein [Salimicrobium album]SDX63280.1 hypothetical protein SAMN04488081_0886 [Salimicrobium album]
MNGVLERALTDKQKLEMVCMDNNGRMTQRIVRIVAVHEEKICYWHKQVRLFKRENILSTYPRKQRQNFLGDDFASRNVLQIMN